MNLTNKEKQKTMKTITANSPRVYVGTYGKYNNGDLDGAWLNLEDYDTPLDFYIACEKLHGMGQDHEFMFQDWEDIPDAYIGESWISDAVWSDFLPLDDEERETFFLYLDNVNDQADYTEVENRYCGTFESVEEFTQEHADLLGDYDKIPTWIVIDWQATWNSNLRHDFVDVDCGNGVMIFCRG